MKVYLIKSSAPGPFKEYKKSMGSPSQNIFSVAAATPENVEITMCDETMGMKPKLNPKTNIVAMFYHTPDAVHTYKLADQYREKGYTVVLGGLHASFLPDEASTHADAVLIGEAEGIWEDLLRDYEEGSLKSFYKRDKPVDLAEVNPFPTNLIQPSRYKYFWTILVSRGCVHRCEFCTVPQFFNGKYRLRPIENIVAEIKDAPKHCWFELHSDNLTANRKYALELFHALKPLKIKWVGEATINLANDYELLKAAAESGCQELLIGIETPSQAALKDSGKKFVDPKSIRQKIRLFHDVGIKITSSMIFGFDSHTTEIFQESVDFCKDIEIDEVESVILIPFPGTPLFERLKSENRILTEDWSLYDGNNTVFTPQNMTTDELSYGADWFWQEIWKNKPLKQPDTPSSTDHEAPYQTKGPILTSAKNRVVRWKSILALAMIAIGFFFNFYWIWGVLFILWAVNDLRQHHTYLLDDIPRSESPVLYTIVVAMWLFLGIWTLVFAPASYSSEDYYVTYYEWQEQQSNETGDIVDESITNTVKTALVGSATMQIELKKSAQVKKNEGKLLPPDASREFKSERFGFTITMPKGWKKKKQTDAHSITLDLQAPNEAGAISTIAIDFKEAFPLKEFITYMESQIAKDIPFIKTSKAINLKNPLKHKKPTGLAMTYREYNGKIEGYQTKVIIGYGVKGQHGFTLIGVYIDQDELTQKAIYESLRSFKISKKQSGAK
jgi:radical SAM superfamily enzyme YgiQ (UPF0313 family)